MCLLCPQHPIKTLYVGAEQPAATLTMLPPQPVSFGHRLRVTYIPPCSLASGQPVALEKSFAVHYSDVHCNY